MEKSLNKLLKQTATTNPGEKKIKFPDLFYYNSQNIQYATKNYKVCKETRKYGPNGPWSKTTINRNYA